MPAILHIGLPKTGTTYIQEWLKLNSDVLSEVGIATLSSLSSHRLATASMEDSKISSRADVMEIERQWQLREALQELTSCGQRTTLVSSEYFFHCNPDDVKTLLDSAAVPVSKIVCFLRRQDRISASGYAQEVNHLGSYKRVTEYGDVKYEEPLDWNNLHEKWTNAFPLAEIVLENFDACQATDSLVDTFRIAIGISHLKTKDLATHVNKSLSADLTELARMMNETGAPFHFDRMLEIERHTELPRFSFAPPITRMFEAVYGASNLLLAQKFPLRFDDFCATNWQPAGIDMTDKLDSRRLADILIDFISLSADEQFRD